jgi:glycerophosphoryl diester phosphodiesterase
LILNSLLLFCVLKTVVATNFQLQHGQNLSILMSNFNMSKHAWGLLIVAFFMACAPPQYKTEKQTLSADFDWQGHRGARGLLPENTIPAFLKALDCGVRTLELDLAVSADNQLIVSHEPWLNHDICSKVDGSPVKKEEAEKSFLLRQMTANDIGQCDCGSRINPRFLTQKPMRVAKPTLTAVAEAVKKYADFNRKPLPYWNIEIKSRPDWDGKYTPSVTEFAQLAVESIKKLGIADRTTIQSFDSRALEAVHKIDPALKTVFLVENLDGLNENLAKLTFKPDVYSPAFKLVTKNLVKKCHAKNLKIVPWTVNDTADMRRLVRLGVDGIITDYPDKIFWQ